MKKKFMEAQIATSLKQSEIGIGIEIEEVFRELDISQAHFFNWNKKYGGLRVSELRRLQLFEAEKHQLKKLVANQSLDKHLLQEALKKL